MRRKRGRYLAVLRGSDEIARNKLIEYLKGDRDVSYPGKSGNRDPVRDIWVLPWYLGTPATTALRQEINSSQYSSISGFINNFAFVTAPPVSERLTVPGLLSSRVAITLQRQGSGTRKTSQLTGKTYLSYGGQTVTAPFGRSTVVAQGGPQDGFAIIFGRVKAANPENLCTFIPANFGVS